MFLKTWQCAEWMIVNGIGGTDLIAAYESYSQHRRVEDPCRDSTYHQLRLAVALAAGIEVPRYAHGKSSWWWPGRRLTAWHVNGKNVSRREMKDTETIHERGALGFF